MPSRDPSCNVIIVGGGPAGMVLARQGMSVTVLETARTFERSFRDDTLHPATLELMAQLGLAENLLILGHTRANTARYIGRENTMLLADFALVRGGYPFLAIMSKSQFPNFLYRQLLNYPRACVLFGARVQSLCEDGTSHDGRTAQKKPAHSETTVHRSPVSGTVRATPNTD